MVVESDKKSEEEVTAKRDVAEKVDALMENNLAPIEKNEEVQDSTEKVLGIKMEETGIDIGNATEVKVKEARGGKRFLVEKCEQQETNNTKETSQEKRAGGPIFQLGEYRARPRPKMQEDKGGGKGGEQPMSLQEEDLKAASGSKSREKRGARALRRRPAGRRVTRQQRLARRSSINGHW